ncbi:flagellar biosynthetic protein FliR [Shewanella woodyi]|uniref:flagellar biosynthetic protein FliR n=1 Tax=Shewanella woodyi TaxID=60961 RepID=UPI00374940EC
MFLFYFRVGAIFWLPLVGPMSRIPKTVRFIVVNILIISVFLMQGAGSAAPVLDGYPYILLLGMELLTGLVFTLILTVPAVVLLFLGRAVDMQIGLGAAGIFNPTSKTQDSLLGVLFSLAALTLFWSLGLHLDVLKILIESTKVLPLGQAYHLSYKIYMEYFSTSFVLGFMIFFPVITSLFIVDVCSGIVSKSMPQMSIYFVIMPLKILIGFIVMAITLTHLSSHFELLVRAPVKFLMGQ